MGDTFVGLLTAHLLADFPLQTDVIYLMKRRGGWGTLLHAGIHTAMTALLVVQPWRWLPLLLVIGLSHFLVDSLKNRLRFRRESLAFLSDQAAHILILAGISVLVPAVPFRLPSSVLYLAAVYAFLPLTLMFLALAWEDVTGGQQDGPSPVARRLIHLSHLAGWPLVMLVFLGLLVPERWLAAF